MISRAFKDVDPLYTYRKFFGVADGAILYSEKKQDAKEPDESYNGMNFLLRRYERTPFEFYYEYVDSNHYFSNEPIKNMSRLTENLLHGVDYENVKNIRTKNFNHLDHEFRTINRCKLIVPDGAYAYPLYLENGINIRKCLQKIKIYIPTLWSDVFGLCSEEDLEY